MDIPKYFSNVVLAQFKATGIPLKVYVNGEYLIITDMYEISDPLIGSGMDEDGNMNQFDYREIDHLLVGGNVIDLATYTKAMAGDTPEQDAKKDEEPKEESIQELTKKEQDLELKSLKLKMDAAKEAMAAAKDKMNQVKKQPTEEAVNEKIKVDSLESAIDAEEGGGLNKSHLRKILKLKAAKRMHTMTSSEEKTYLKLLRKYKIGKDGEAMMEALDGSFANAQKLLRNSTVVSYEFDRNNNGDWFVLIKYVPMNKQKVEMTVVNMGQDYSSADLNKIKREFGLDKPVKKKYRLSNPMSGGQGYGEIFEASAIKKGSYVTNKDGLVGRVDNISGDKEIADIRYNDGKEESLPIKNLKIFESVNETEDYSKMHNVELNATYKKKFGVKDTKGLTRDELIKKLKSVNENHDYTFGIGDIVKNKNTSCPHHGSMGIVQKIMKLANDMGMVVKYRVVNSGPTYNPGDSLIKTMDQLEPVQDPAETEAPMDENK